MGAGKTAVGTALARMLGVPFADMDAEIEKAAAMTVAEIFERDGETFFRQREAAVLSRMLDGPPKVLSTGGGAFMGERNREIISERGASVWLKADLDLLWNRVRHKTTRPLLQTPNPKETLTSLFNARNDTYAMADVTVQALPDITVEEMASRVLNALKAAGLLDQEQSHVR